ncbi:hypothetical protein RJ640_019324 [Escallonia rubra]|uniref:Uncharacterized protein n=1 Tax=Escallonia rubra TaxID=112253 RepID=A0AA88RNU5_9ASTE|nr:hypothetical protein RJ640_019324 [Escallonia rubra]
MSHCGWNSCMESMSMGVPIATWPMHSDQPRNAVLITKALKVGVVVNDWARRDELVTSLTVEKAVKQLMATKEGDEIRKRAKDLGIAITDEQIKELAVGLEKSGQKVIWVLRDADKGDVFQGEVRRAELPKGYEERIEGKGMVFRDWAPQMEILGHPSTGGFMSHCGWNSCMESITMGVPIAAWPMHSDQPRNTVLIAKVLKIGLVMRDWTRRNETVMSSTVEDVVRRLMASEEGDEIRKRAVELGGAVRRSVDEGGITRMELDSFLSHISRELLKYKNSKLEVFIVLVTCY